MADQRARRVRRRLTRIRQGLSPAEWARFGGMVATVVGLNVAGWGMLAAALGGHYHIGKTTVFGVGTGALAYTLGMRHAFDADHIAAIDNTTRKLVGEGKRPLSVGFFFSLGHSSVVFLLAILLNFGIRDLDRQVSDGGSGLHSITSIVGTAVSGFFLFLIAAFNIVILVGILGVVLWLAVWAPWGYRRRTVYRRRQVPPGEVPPTRTYPGDQPYVDEYEDEYRR